METGELCSKINGVTAGKSPRIDVSAVTPNISVGDFPSTPALGLQQESEVSSSQNTRRSGYLFIAAGCMFFFAAYLGKQVAFCGIGVAFIAIGAAYVARAKRA
ncbi:MAG: hypothetical protein ACREPQ_01730 [Rhodanobacter sp.]